MRISPLLLSATLPLILGGCVASVAKDIVTAPVKVVSKTADVLTTSQSESDEKRGKALRKKEERLGKLARKRDKAQRKCDDGSRSACDDVIELEAEIDREQDRPV